MLSSLTVTPNQTPIEIALGIDGEGMTTAKKLYEFLELDKSNYSKWYKANIIDNQFAEEDVDYEVFVPKDENPQGGRPTHDFKLTAAFAKKLSMTAKNERGEQAREYFIKAEDKLKETVIQTNQLPPDLQISKAILDQQIKQYIEIQQLKEDNQKVNERIESIREVVALDTTSWREDTGNILRKIGTSLGGGQWSVQICKR